MTVIDEIVAERQRQITEKNYDSAHDDEHNQGEIAMAAACYAAPVPIYRVYAQERSYSFINPWPWYLIYDKRPIPAQGYAGKPRRTLLIQAAAMLVAEIERLDRRAAEGL